MIFQECLIEGDTSSIWHVAKAIHKLEVFMHSLHGLEIYNTSKKHLFVAEVS